MIDWDKASTWDIQQYGKWLNWAQDWAEFKAQTNAADPGDMWRSEVKRLADEQSKFRDILFNRKDPYATREPSNTSVPTGTNL